LTSSSIHYSKEKYGEQEYENLPTCSSELSEDDYEGTGYDFEIEEEESPEKGCNCYLTEPYILDVADAMLPTNLRWTNMQPRNIHWI
jgi:hypothetical protein